MDSLRLAAGVRRLQANLSAVLAYATLGEIQEAMVKVHSEYREPAVF